MGPLPWQFFALARGSYTRNGKSSLDDSIPRSFLAPFPEHVHVLPTARPVTERTLIGDGPHSLQTRNFHTMWRLFQTLRPGRLSTIGKETSFMIRFSLFMRRSHRIVPTLAPVLAVFAFSSAASAQVK